MKKVIFAGMLLASVVGLSSFTLKNDTAAAKHATVSDKKDLATADDKKDLATADDKKDLATADARKHTTTNDKKDLATAD